MTTSTEDLGERVSRLEGGYEHVATKADIAETKAGLADVKSELKSDISVVKDGVAQLRTEIAQLETRITLHLGAFIVAASAVVVGLQKLLE